MYTFPCASCEKLFQEASQPGEMGRGCGSSFHKILGNIMLHYIILHYVILHYIMLYYIIIGFIMEFYRDNGKEHGSYYLGFRV